MSAIEFTESDRAAGEAFVRLAAASDEFEGYAHPHAVRIAKIADAVARLFHLAQQDRSALRVAALAHDLGETAMERDYIKRAGPLTEDERIDLARHPVIGEQESARAGASRGAQLLVRWHQEWWNGAGYPDALRGEQIPLAARILRVADAYASLTDARPYRPALTGEEAHRHLKEWAGLEFDPRVVSALLALRNIPELNSYAEKSLESGVWSLESTAKEPVLSFDSRRAFDVTDSRPLWNGWLAFELGVLRRLKFKTVSLPFGGEPDLGLYLKRWSVRVAANDLAQWSAMKATAFIQNNDERLTEEDVALVVEDAYVPRYKLRNLALRKWFNETDAWWFDNVRENALRLSSPVARALALSLGMTVGDYVFSFDEESREFRQPLSQVFRRAWEAQAQPVNNSERNTSDNREARDFVAEQHTDLMYLRLPRARGVHDSRRRSASAWREEWVRGEDGFWGEIEQKQVGRLGASVVSKQQYLRLVEDLLRVALHIPVWAVAHVEDGFVPTTDLVETISRVRKVETIYSKDFSELTGLRATIITA